MAHRISLSLVGWATILLALSGCNAADEPSKDDDETALSRKDGGEPDSGTTSPSDAGASESDAGASASDAGGSTRDAGESPRDAGTSASDASMGTRDAAVRIDAGGSTGGCAVTLCRAGTYCDDIDGTARCIESPSCNTVKCAAGTVCKLVAVQCIRAPCPAQPQCVMQ